MTIQGLLEKNAERFAEQTALVWHERKAWQRRTWKEWLVRVKEVAEGYGTRFALEPRRDNGALVLGNSPDWLESYLALAGSGIAVVPMDPKLHAGEMAYILHDAEVKVITTDRAHLKMMLELVPQLPHLRALVLVDAKPEDEQTVGAVQVVALASLRVAGGGAWFAAHQAQAEDVASIIYTSGTTGKPKGAMLTHHNLVSDAAGALATFGADLRQTDNFLVVLPLFHAFSFTANFVVCLITGSTLSFVESLRTVGRDIRSLRPSVICAVPLLAEKLYEKVQEALEKSKLARFLMKIGLRGPVMHMVLLKLGGRLRYMVTGGAPCPKHVLECFRRLHVNFVEGYGLTECSPIVSVTGAEIEKIGTIGKPCQGVEVRLAEVNENGVGELQVRGAVVMKGYFHNEAATREAFDGEWLATGDLASIDEEGLITIRGRKKALIVNREGKNIYPEEVEIAVAKDPCVKDVIVVGYTQGGVPGERVGAIVYPNEDWFAAGKGSAKPSWAEIEKIVIRRVQEKSAELADYKRIRKVVVAHEPLERTSIGKVRRVTYKGKLDE